MPESEPSVSPNFDAPVGFFGELGAVYEELSADRVVAVLDIEPRHHQPFGLVHGGVYCALVEDTASHGAALWGLTRGMSASVGVSNFTDFIRPHREGRIRAVATPIHRGRSQQLWQVDITRDADGKRIARGRVRLHNLTDGSAVLESDGPSS